MSRGEKLTTKYQQEQSFSESESEDNFEDLMSMQPSERLQALQKKTVDQMKQPTDELGFYPIHAAAAENDRGSLLYLIQNKVDLNQTDSPRDYDSKGITALHRLAVRAERGAAKNLQLLLSNGATPFKLDESGLSPLHRAVLEKDNHQNVATLAKAMARKKTLDHNVDFCDQKSGLTALHLASNSSDKLKYVEILIKYKANPDLQDKKEGNTALHFAVVADHTKKQELVRYLLSDSSVDLTLRDKKGRTALDLERKTSNTTIADFVKKKYIKILLKAIKQDEQIQQKSFADASSTIDFLAQLPPEGTAEGLTNAELWKLPLDSDNNQIVHLAVSKKIIGLIIFLHNKGALVDFWMPNKQGLSAVDLMRNIIGEYNKKAGPKSGEMPQIVTTCYEIISQLKKAKSQSQFPATPDTSFTSATDHGTRTPDKISANLSSDSAVADSVSSVAPKVMTPQTPLLKTPVSVTEGFGVLLSAYKTGYRAKGDPAMTPIREGESSPTKSASPAKKRPRSEKRSEAGGVLQEEAAPVFLSAASDRKLRTAGRKASLILPTNLAAAFADESPSAPEKEDNPDTPMPNPKSGFAIMLQNVDEQEQNPGEETLNPSRKKVRGSGRGY